MNEKSPSKELLTRYLEGKCNPEEVERVEKWFADWGASKEEANLPDFNQPAHLARIVSILKEQGAFYHADRKQNLRILPVFWRIAVAASIVLVALFTVYRTLEKTALPHSLAVDEPKPMVVRNTTKQVLKAQLPDGSSVWLNPGSRLEYPREFAKEIREVTIEGEAFFDVFQDKNHPFIVKSGTLITRVIGTSFNVKAELSASIYEVAVVSGKVEVSAHDKSGKGQRVYLLPSQKATYNTSSHQLSSVELPLRQVVAESWQPVSLTFEDEKLSEVVKLLEHQFGVRIRIANPRLSDCRLKATFEKQRLAEIIEMTTQMLDATYEMNEKEIILDGSGCDDL